MNEAALLTQILNVDWAFSNGSFLDGSRKKTTRFYFTPNFLVKFLRDDSFHIKRSSNCIFKEMNVFANN